MLKSCTRLRMSRVLLCLAANIGMVGCVSHTEKSSEMPNELVSSVKLIPNEPVPLCTRTPLETKRIRDLERQFAERQRNCLEDKIRLEQTIRENQKHIDELQRKLDSLLAIDRQLRNREKALK